MAIDDKGRTALHYALTDFDWYFSKEEEMELEHEGRNNIFQDSTNQEALNKLKRITDILIENKIDLNTADINGQTPLHTACSGNFPEIVKEFLRNKVNVNASDKDDFTPLHIACFKCHFFPVQLLIEHGGRVNATDVHGSSPLHLACVIGNLEVVSTLVKYGAKINIPDKTGSTPLHIAIKNTRQDVIYFLLYNEANVNARDNDGFTPLLLCCCQNYNEIVEILLRFGADYEIEISEGVNAVTMAIKCHHYDISDVLFENGAHLYENNLRYLLQCFINTNDIFKFLNKYRGTINKYRNKKGQSILHIATLDNNSYWVGTLLNKTELFKEVDNRGQTAFLYAIYSEVASIIDLFLERCTSGDAITLNLRKKLQRGYICFLETLFKISRLHFDEFEMVFDSGNHDIVRKFMRNVKDYYLTDFTIKYCSSGYDKIITEALKCGKYIDMYNIILARLPDELWNLHKSIIPCLCPERGETSSQNWIKQGEEIEKCLPFDLNLFMLSKFEIWPLLILRKDCNLIMRYIGERFRYPMNDYLNLLSITDAIGNTFLHYSSLIPNMYFTFDCFNHFKRDFLLSIDEHVNRQNLAGCTPLHYAVQCPCPLNISTLIELGADIEVKDKSGRDVLDYSKAYGFQDTEEILKRYDTYRR
ncbi:ankyrin-2-like [Saccostrea cucullata]|uniref:ankyrin-2-like n=1 Tax=Saccostrea cuccullata TaxID=36930 RepID=UPI002ED53895